MIFKSKMIFDPSTRFDNRMGLTIGLTVHTPKFWDCQKSPHDVSHLDEPPLDDETKERKYRMRLAHRSCKRRHLSYRGYAYWTAPKRRYEFRYMGRSFSHQSKWPFSVHKHSTYTRLLDNGPQWDGPSSTISNEDIKLLSPYRDEFARKMREVRVELDEYYEKRGGLS